MIANNQSGTSVDEIADGIFRIHTPVQIEGAGGFSFNQYLIADDEPLLFHTGPRKLFPLVLEAVNSVIPAATLRHVGFSHFEADECGSLNEWLAAAPRSAPLCGALAAVPGGGRVLVETVTPSAERIGTLAAGRRVRYRLGRRT